MISTIEVAELRNRLMNAADDLNEMAVDQYDREERTRLLGKVEGVRLALGYLDEMMWGSR